MCMVDDGNGWTVLSDTKPRSRRDRRCEDCRRTIATGEQYHRVTGVTPDGFYTGIVCAQCDAAADWLRTVCHGFLFEAIRADLEEHWQEVHPYRCASLGRLVVGIRRGWRLKRGGLIDPEHIRSWAERGAAKALAAGPA